MAIVPRDDEQDGKKTSPSLCASFDFLDATMPVRDWDGELEVYAPVPIEASSRRFPRRW